MSRASRDCEWSMVWLPMDLVIATLGGGVSWQVGLPGAVCLAVGGTFASLVGGRAAVSLGAT